VVAESGLAGLATNWVAPASECTAPSDADAVNTARSSDTTRDGERFSAITAAGRKAGTRCRSSMSQSAGR
jgi:hypothetical protein